MERVRRRTSEAKRTTGVNRRPKAGGRVSRIKAVYQAKQTKRLFENAPAGSLSLALPFSLPDRFADGANGSTVMPVMRKRATSEV